MERRQWGWSLMIPDGKRAKLQDYDNLFKTYMTRIKKGITGVISEKINPESDIHLWISGNRGSTS